MQVDVVSVSVPFSVSAVFVLVLPAVVAAANARMRHGRHRLHADRDRKRESAKPQTGAKQPAQQFSNGATGIMAAPAQAPPLTPPSAEPLPTLTPPSPSMTSGTEALENDPGRGYVRPAAHDPRYLICNQ